MDEYKAGDLVIVVDVQGEKRRKRALGPVMQGGSFPVVLACREEEWEAAHAEGRDPVGIPWPAEDVSLLEEVPADLAGRRAVLSPVVG